MRRFGFIFLFILISFCLCLFTCRQMSLSFAKEQTSYQVWWRGSTQKIFKGSRPSKLEGKEVFISAAKGEYEPFQLMIRAEDRDLKEVKISVSELLSDSGRKISQENIKLYLEDYIFVDRPVMGGKRGYHPNALPCYRPFDLSPKETQPIWINAYIPRDAQAGEYKGMITVQPANASSFFLPLNLRVFDFSLPLTPTLKTAFGLGYSYVAKAHNLGPQDKEYQKIMDKYYFFLLEHRISPYCPPVPVMSKEAGKYLNDPRVTTFRAPFSEDPKEMKRIINYLRERDWLKKAYWYVIDEPAWGEYSWVRRVGDYLNSLEPETKFLVTIGPRESLFNAQIDIWCPILGYFDDPQAERRVEEERAKGKEVWWYTCCSPKYPAMTYFIDDTLTGCRVLSWMQYIYGVSGLLYWETTYWSGVKDPWEEAMTYPGANGDGCLIYPGSKVGYPGPVSSLRLELIREGLEDYEYLKILEERIEKVKKRLSFEEYDSSERIKELSYPLIQYYARKASLAHFIPHLAFLEDSPFKIYACREMVAREILSVDNPPLILIKTEPKDNHFTYSPKVVVSGMVEKGAEVLVQGKKVSLDNKGRFTLDVPLHSGINVIEIIAKLGDKEKIVRRFINGI